jgi:uncharacterized protein (TIGR02147 family)
MDIYQYEDYKEYLEEVFKSLGRGQKSKIAEHLRVHSSLLSQILKGDKHFTLEQGCGLCEFLQLSEEETEYFLVLLELARAGSDSLREHFLHVLRKLQKSSYELGKYLPGTMALDDEAMLILGSQWHFSAILSLLSIPGYQSVDSIARYFKLPRKLVHRLVKILVAKGLCTQKAGILKAADKSPHISLGSPLISQYHLSWRLKAIQRAENLQKDELMLSGQTAVSKKDYQKIRKLLTELIQKVGNISDKTKEEQLMCLNIDFFKL